MCRYVILKIATRTHLLHSPAALAPLSTLSTHPLSTHLTLNLYSSHPHLYINVTIKHENACLSTTLSYPSLMSQELHCTNR